MLARCKIDRHQPSTGQIHPHILLTRFTSDMTAVSFSSEKVSHLPGNYSKSRGDRKDDEGIQTINLGGNGIMIPSHPQSKN